MLGEIKEKLSRGEIIVGANVVMSDPEVSELMGFAGCDYTWVDMEHAALNHKDIEQHIMAAHSGGAAAFVRIPWNDQVLAKRILDMGPDGIIFPFIRTRKDAENAVAACRFPPDGIRGWNPLRVLKYGLEDTNEFLAHYDSMVWKIIMVEHIDCVNDLENILAVDRIDAIIIGPSDLTGSMGKLLQTDTDEFWGLIKKITDIAKKAGVVIGAAVPTNCPQDKLLKWMQYGVQMFSIGQDSFMLASIVKNNVDATRDIYNKSGIHKG